MRILRFAVLLIPALSAAHAQEWELGGVGGGGFSSNVTATAPAGSATAGFATGFAAGAFVRENMQRFAHISGEVRYEYLQRDLRLSAAGQTAQFSGHAQAFHYDAIFHTSSRETRAQFFGAAGGGVMAFTGTGTEAAYQPLSQYGYFTKTGNVKPMISVGGGFTYRLGSRLVFRAEVRDFITGFPTGVLTPPPGVKYGKWLNDVVPMVGISYSPKASASQSQSSPATSTAPAAQK